MHSSGPIIAPKRTLWLDLEPNSLRAQTQDNDTLGVILLSIGVSTWHGIQSVAVNMWLALPNEKLVLPRSSTGPGVSGPVYGAAVPPDVVAVLTRNASGMWTADLKGNFFEHGLLGGWNGNLLLQPHVLNVTVNCRAAVDAPGADNYGVRHEFDAMVHTVVVDGGSGMVDVLNGNILEPFIQYEWTYNASAVDELLWDMVMDNLYCHGLSEESSQVEVDSVVLGICDIIGHIASQPKVRVTPEVPVGAVRYLNEYGEDVLRYELPSRSPHRNSGGNGATVITAAGTDKVRAMRGGGTRRGAGYGNGGRGPGNVVGSVHTGKTDVGRRRRYLNAVAAAIWGLLSSYSGGAAATCGSDRSTTASVATRGSLVQVLPEGTLGMQHQKKHAEDSPKDWNSMVFVLAGGSVGGGGGLAAASALPAAAIALISDIVRWLLGKLMSLQEHFYIQQKQQQDEQTQYGLYGGGSQEELEEELMWGALAVLGAALVLALVLVMLVRGTTPRALLRLGTCIGNGLHRRSLRRDKTRRDHAPPSLIAAAAAMAAAASVAGPQTHSTAGGSGSGGGAAGIDGPRSRGSATATATMCGAIPRMAAINTTTATVAIVHTLQLSRPHERSKRTPSSGSSSVGGACSSASVPVCGGGATQRMRLPEAVTAAAAAASRPTTRAAPSSLAQPPQAPSCAPPRLVHDVTTKSTAVSGIRTSSILGGIRGAMLRLILLLLQKRVWPQRRSACHIARGVDGEVVGVAVAARHIGPKGANRTTPVYTSNSNRPIGQCAGAHTFRKPLAAAMSRSPQREAQLLPPLPPPQQQQSRHQQNASMSLSRQQPWQTQAVGSASAPRHQHRAGPQYLAGRGIGLSSPRASRGCIRSSSSTATTAAGPFATAAAVAVVTAAVAAGDSPEAGESHASLHLLQVPEVRRRQKAAKFTLVAASATVAPELSTSPPSSPSAAASVPKGPHSPTSAPLSPTAAEFTAGVRGGDGTILPPQSRSPSLDPEHKMVPTGKNGVSVSLFTHESDPGPGLVVARIPPGLHSQSWAVAEEWRSSPLEVVAAEGCASAAGSAMSSISSQAGSFSKSSTGKSFTLGLPPLTSNLSLPGGITTPAMGGILGYSWGCSCDGANCRGAGGGAAAPTMRSRRSASKQPWSLALLAEMAGDSALRLSQFEAAAAHDFACLACHDAPRECGFLHGDSVHMGLCSACVSRLTPRADGTLLICPVCKQAVDRMVEVML